MVRSNACVLRSLTWSRRHGFGQRWSQYVTHRMNERIAIRAKYESALALLVEKLKSDRLVLAVILCGSLSHDEVWKKSDIDLVVVMTDDLKEYKSIALCEDDINIHAGMISRSNFVAIVHGSLQGSFLHSLLSKGKPIFIRDESLVEVCESLGHLGGRDREIAMLRALQPVFPTLDKAEKWLYAKNDPIYCFFWIMKLVDSVAQLEAIFFGEIPGREVINQAKLLNPDLIEALYDRLIEGPKTYEAIDAALTRIREHLLFRREAFAPLIAYLSEAVGARSATEINHDFNRQMGIEGVDGMLEWMAEQGLVLKLSVPSRLMPKSRVSVEETAYTVEAR